MLINALVLVFYNPDHLFVVIKTLSNLENPNQIRFILYIFGISFIFVLHIADKLSLEDNI